MLPVSFFIVRSVVEQGQWRSEKSIAQIAVLWVHPFWIKIERMNEVSDMSVKFDELKYIISAIGRTISFAGSPNINARRIVPSRPKKLAGASKKFEISTSRLIPFMFILFKMKITRPAGAATVTALAKINRIFVLTEFIMVLKKSGVLYGGSSKVNEDASPFKNVLDKK